MNFKSLLKVATTVPVTLGSASKIEGVYKEVQSLNSLVRKLDSKLSSSGLDKDKKKFEVTYAKLESVSQTLVDLVEAWVSKALKGVPHFGEDLKPEVQDAFKWVDSCIEECRGQLRHTNDAYRKDGPFSTRNRIQQLDHIVGYSTKLIEAVHMVVRAS